MVALFSQAEESATGAGVTEHNSPRFFNQRNKNYVHALVYLQQLDVKNKTYILVHQGGRGH